MRIDENNNTNNFNSNILRHGEWIMNLTHTMWCGRVVTKLLFTIKGIITKNTGNCQTRMIRCSYEQVTPQLTCNT